MNKPESNHKPMSSGSGRKLEMKTDLEIGETKCCRSHLTMKAEVLDQLSENGASFTALEPIRNRYMEQYGNDLCWSYPLYMYNHLGCVLLLVQEGVLYLPYNSLDNETYEQFDLECVKLLTADTAKKLKDDLLSQLSELYAVLIDLCRELGVDEHGSSKGNLTSEGSDV